jgi:hypothetical protein
MKKFIALLFLSLSLAGVASAQIKLIQSTAIDVAVGPFTDTTGTILPSLTISNTDVRLKKNAAAWGPKSQASSCTYEEGGWYECSLDTTDTNTLGILVLAVNESGALPVWVYFEVVGSASHALLVGGNVASSSDIWNTATASVTAGIGLQLKTNADIPVSQTAGLITRGTAQAGAANTITLETLAPAISLVNKRIVLTGGTGANQSGIITAYNTSTKLATVRDSATGGNWTTNPASGTTYVVRDDYSPNDLMVTPYEGTETFVNFLRMGAAMLFNNYTSSAGTFNFRDAANTKTRVQYSTSPTSRTTTARDGN